MTFGAALGRGLDCLQHNLKAEGEDWALSLPLMLSWMVWAEKGSGGLLAVGTLPPWEERMDKGSWIGGIWFLLYLWVCPFIAPLNKLVISLLWVLCSGNRILLVAISNKSGTFNTLMDFKPSPLAYPNTQILLQGCCVEYAGCRHEARLAWIWISTVWYVMRSPYIENDPKFLGINEISFKKKDGGGHVAIVTVT